MYSFSEAFYLFADGPENCSSEVVVPVIKVTVNAQDHLKLDVLITLPSNVGLMCVERYRIHFDGRNETVSATTPSATFIVSNIPGQAILDGAIYTLDFENRTSQIPCTFNFTGESPFMTHYVIQTNGAHGFERYV